jgi:hypothetical protein
MTWRYSTQPLGTKLALFVGTVGFAWAVVVVTPATFLLLDKPSTEDRKPFSVPGDTEYGDLGSIWARLSGIPKSERKPCWGGSADWHDHEPLVRGRGPRNGSTETFWIAKTINSQTFVGRYSLDVWYLIQASTGAGGFTSAIQTVENTRLIERFPPPPPGPPGWEPLQPGACLLREAKPLDDEGTVGKFVIDLPANTRIDEECASRHPYGKGKFSVDCTLTQNGKEAPHVSVDPYGAGFYYKSEEAGQYELVVRRSDPREAWRPDHGRWAKFFVTVALGGGRAGCGAAMDQSNCFGEKVDE